MYQLFVFVNIDRQYFSTLLEQHALARNSNVKSSFTSASKLVTPNLLHYSLITACLAHFAI